MCVWQMLPTFVDVWTEFVDGWYSAKYAMSLQLSIVIINYYYYYKV